MNERKWYSCGLAAGASKTLIVLELYWVAFRCFLTRSACDYGGRTAGHFSWDLQGQSGHGLRGQSHQSFTLPTYNHARHGPKAMHHFMRQLWSDIAVVWSAWNSAKGTGRSDVGEQLLRSEPIKETKGINRHRLYFWNSSSQEHWHFSLNPFTYIPWPEYPEVSQTLRCSWNPNES